MKITKLFAAAILIFACSTTSFAQFMGGGSSKVGGGGGARVSGGSSIDSYNALWVSYLPTTMKASGNGYSSSQSGYNTFAVGVTHAQPLSTTSALLEYGVFGEFTTKSEKESGVTSTMNLIGAKVPVNVLYGLDLGGFVIYPYAGLNARFYVSGKYSLKYEGESESSDVFGDDSDMKRFNLGYQVGVRANFSNFFVGVGYEDMITSMSTDDDYKLKFNMINLGVGFMF